MPYCVNCKLTFLFLRHHFTPFQQSSCTSLVSYACPSQCLCLISDLLNTAYHMMKMYMLQCNCVDFHHIPAIVSFASYMEHNTSFEANSHSVGQEFMAAECSLICSEESVLIPVQSQRNPVHNSIYCGGLLPSCFAIKTVYLPVVSDFHSPCPPPSILSLSFG